MELSIESGVERLNDFLEREIEITKKLYDECSADEIEMKMFFTGQLAELTVVKLRVEILLGMRC